MDCFYAAIEVRDRPALRGKPVGVGGARDRRGVLTTCNYEARKFGVHSAMPTFMALQRCPNLIVLPTRFDVYRREAAVVREILHRFSPLVEPLSLDEAYLDVTAHPGAPGPLAEVRRDAKTEWAVGSDRGGSPGIHARFTGARGLGDRRKNRTEIGGAGRENVRRASAFLTSGPGRSFRQIWERALRSVSRN